jgi:CheY-like chemotaxis protein
VLYPLSYGGSGRGKGYQRRVPCPKPKTPSAADASVRHVTDKTTRVLVVDDSDTIRSLISLNLELEGFEVVQAGDGQECLDMVSAVQPDVITLDVAMPRLDGFGAAARLRSSPDTSHIPIVMVTARAQGSDLERGAELGVAAYVTKPFEPTDLVDVVRSVATGRTPPHPR